MMLKRRKIWIALYRLGLIMPQTALGLILSSMMADLMSIQSSIEEVKSKIESVSTDKTEDNARLLLEDSRLSTFFRIFWYLNKIVTGHTTQMMDASSSFEEIWVRTIEWLVDPANIKVLSTISISMYLEVYFELFLNTDFTSSGRVAKNLRERVKMIDTCMKESKQTIDLSSNEDESSDREGFYTFKAVLDVLFMFCDPKLMPDISFLALKLINLSIFSSMTEDIPFVRKVITNLLSSPFVGDRLWFHYQPIGRDDFEEQLIRVIASVKDSSLSSDSKDLSYENKHYRVYC